MLRPDLARFFPTKATVYRLQKTQDKWGGTKNEWVKIEWEVPSRLYGYSGIYTVEIDGTSYTASVSMMCGVEVDIEIGDKVSANGDSYIVIREIPRFTALEEHHKTLLLARMDK